LKVPLYLNQTTDSSMEKWLNVPDQMLF